LLILPDETHSCMEFKEKLAKYLNRGGAVLATGQAVEALPKEIVRKTDDEVSEPVYLKLRKEISCDIPDMPHVVKSGFLKIKAFGAQTLATLTKPYKKVGPRFYYSNLQIPYAEDTDEPVIIEYGKLIYIASSLFREYWEIGYGVHRQILVNCLKRLLPEPLVKARLPLQFSVSLLEQGGRRICIIVPYFSMRRGEHVEQIEEWPKITGVSLSILGSYRMVYIAPTRKQIPCSKEDNYTIVSLPPFEGPIVVVFENPKETNLK